MRRLKDLEGALQPLQRFSQANPELEQVSASFQSRFRMGKVVLCNPTTGIEAKLQLIDWVQEC